MSHKFLELFNKRKPIIGVLHLKGDTDKDILDRAIRELDYYIAGGIDAVIVENYYGNYHNVEQVLSYIVENRQEICYGVNCLNLDVLGFELAKKYKAKFIQLDSVVGHLKPRDDISMKVFLDLYRKKTDALILGGVRFKYQPYLSGRTLEEDLELAKERCDAVVVTQDATGQETSVEKIKEFREILGDFPLIVGAGVTPDNCETQLEYVDGAIVGSYFKDTYKDTGDVCLEHVKSLVKSFDEIR